MHKQCSDTVLVEFLRFNKVTFWEVIHDLRKPWEWWWYVIFCRPLLCYSWDVCCKV